MQGTQNGTESGYIEFVARPTRYNNVNVATKDAASSSQDEIEDVIYNLYFLLFENSTNDGRLIYFEELDPSAPNASLKADKGLTGAYACFLANVTEDFAKSITTVGGLKSAIYEIQEYATSNGRLGVPVIEIDGEETPCLPMFGASANPINMSGAGTAEIALRRLFAKVILNLNVAIPDDNTSTFTLDKVSLTNLPDRVALTTPAGESAWTASTSTYFANPVSLDQIDGAIVSNGSGYQMVCYVPEYKVTAEINASQVEGYNAEYDAQFYKPLLCPNKRPSYITIEGSMGGNIYVYKIYLGEDNHSNFNLLRNTQYTNNVTITGTSSKDVDHRVTYTTMPTMLVNGEAANCYIISMPGKYQLDTYQGVCKNLSNVTPLKGYPFIVANDGNVSLSLWNSGTFDDKIIMDVGNNGTLGQYISTLTSGGNAVVGLNSKSDATGEWLWTWHLWFSVELSGEVLGQQITLLNVATQSYPGGPVLMDRNLGATPSIEHLATPGLASGLYYKYGCKNPYFNGTYNGGGVLYDNDGKELIPSWSSSKSSTDPCPPGYKVPNTSVWENSDSSKETDLTGGFLLFRSGITSAYYPYYNYLLADGSVDTNTTGFVPFNEGYSFETTGMHGKAPLDLGIFGTKDVDAICRNKFTLTDMDIQTTREEGRLWCSDGYICYDHNTLDLGAVFDGGVASLRQKLQINQYTHERKVVEKYKPELSISDLRKVLNLLQSGQLTESMLEPWIDKWGEYQLVNPPAMTTDDMNTLLAKLILLDRNSINLTDYRELTTSIDKMEGYQVRCMVDTQQ